MKLYQARDKAKRDIFINLIKLNSEAKNYLENDLIGVSNELVINADKKFAKINELEREVEELKAKLEEKDN
nr:14736_t:CDS:2 [Entrophospora candida]